MKVAIIYYSETGNTEKAAGYIREGLEKGNIETALFNLREGEPDDSFMKECKGVICGSPAYYANMCWQMKKWLDTSKNCWTAGKLGGAFATAGCSHGGGDVAVLTIIQHLLVKGMMVYSSGAEYGRPVIHLGPVGIKSTAQSLEVLEGQKELFVLYGERFSRKINELFTGNN